jgi:hypothetical protein
VAYFLTLFFTFTFDFFYFQTAFFFLNFPFPLRQFSQHEEQDMNWQASSKRNTQPTSDPTNETSNWRALESSCWVPYRFGCSSVSEEPAGGWSFWHRCSPFLTFRLSFFQATSGRDSRAAQPMDNRLTDGTGEWRSPAAQPTDGTGKRSTDGQDNSCVFFFPIE